MRKGVINGQDVEYFTASMAIDYLVDKSPRSKGGKTEETPYLMWFLCLRDLRECHLVQNKMVVIWPLKSATAADIVMKTTTKRRIGTSHATKTTSNQNSYTGDYSSPVINLSLV